MSKSKEVLMISSQFFERVKDSKVSGKYLTPFQKKLLSRALTTDLRHEYRRRIEIMLLADLGYSQSEICTELKCSHETARYWIKVAQTGQAHHWNDRPMGRPKQVSQEYQSRLQELINHSPRDYGYSFHSWTAQWLSRHLSKEFGVEYSTRHIYRLLKKIGVSSKQVKMDNSNKKQKKLSKISIGHLQPSSPQKSLDI